MKRNFLIHWLIRVALLLIGLTIAHLGVTLFLQADMGSDPFNVLIQGLYRFLPWPKFITHGTVHVIISFLIILALLFIDRSYILIGTLLCMILGGPIIDVFTVILAPIIHSQSPLILRLLSLVAGCVILASGTLLCFPFHAEGGIGD